MVVAGDDVRRWLSGVAPDVGLTVLSTAAGYSRMLIGQQIAGDRVKEETIVRVARVLGLDPLTQLRTFPSHASLAPSCPDTREVGAFIRWEYLLRACASLELGEPITEISLGPVWFGETSRQWINCLDQGRGLRENLERNGQISGPALAKALGGPLRWDLAVLSARFAGVPQASAMVVARLLTPAEAGWKVDERVQWLKALSRQERLSFLERRVHAAVVRRHIAGISALNK